MPSFTKLVASLLALVALFCDEAAANPIRIVTFGDSLTSGYLLAPDEGFTAQLERALRARGLDVSVDNASVAGDTTAQGLARLDWSMPSKVDAVIVELGANDGLRALSTGQIESNLDAILARLEARRVPILLAGMRAPRNLGADYDEAFDALFPRVASRHLAVYYPFFLDGVVGDPSLNLPDGLHPNSKGIGIIVERITPKVEELLSRVGAR